MPIRVTCACGKAYHFKDEFAGRRAKCLACGAETRIPEAPKDTTPGADKARTSDMSALPEITSSESQPPPNPPPIPQLSASPQIVWIQGKVVSSSGAKMLGWAGFGCALTPTDLVLVPRPTPAGWLVFYMAGPIFLAGFLPLAPFMLGLIIYIVCKEIKNRKRWKFVESGQLDLLVINKALKRFPLTAMPREVKFTPSAVSLDLPFRLGKHHMVLRGTTADSQTFTDFAEECARRKINAGHGNA